MIQVESLSPHFSLQKEEAPVFGLCKSIPDGIPSQIEAAVKDFMATSHIPKGIDPRSFYQQTLQTIAARAVMNQPGGELWLGISGGDLWTYILAHVGQDLDGRLAYTVTQAWVRKDQRGKKWVKQAWQKVRQRAKDCFASHFVVISSRGNDAAYCRFLGKGFHFYASILKEEL
jgi:hypothetical protein